MYLGHVITTTCLHQGLKRLNVKLFYPIFLLGTLFPDLVDKSIALATDLPGRSVCHSAVVLTALFLVLIFALPKKRKTTYTFFAGTILHLIQDIPIGVDNLLWPFWGPLEYGDTESYLIKLWRYYVELNKPIPWVIEMICLPWFIVIVISRRKKLLRALLISLSALG